MNIRLPLILSLLIVTAMAALSTWAWPLVPDTARIAVHFDANGAANGFADKARALIMLPALSLGLIALLSVIPRIEPRRLNLVSSAKFYRTAWIGVIAILAIAHATIVLKALRVAVDVPHFVLPALALLFMVIGNYMGKTRSNFFAGVRTPWTLSSEYSWEKTHRLVGRLFMLVGAAGLLVSFAADKRLAATMLIGGVLASALIGIVASYIFWRRDPLRHSGDGVPE